MRCALMLPSPCTRAAPPGCVRITARGSPSASFCPEVDDEQPRSRPATAAHAPRALDPDHGHAARSMRRSSLTSTRGLGLGEPAPRSRRAAAAAASSRVRAPTRAACGRAASTRRPARSPAPSSPVCASTSCAVRRGLASSVCPPKQAAVTRFSNTLMFPKGYAAHVAAAAGAGAAALVRTQPRHVAAVVVDPARVGAHVAREIRLNGVVLPPLLGPGIRSVLALGHRKRDAVGDLERAVGLALHALQCQQRHGRSGHRAAAASEECPARPRCSRGGVPPLYFVPLPHWPSTSGVLLTFLEPALAAHCTGPTTDWIEVAATHRAHRPGLERLRRAQRVGRHLEQRVREADRLRPLAASCRPRRPRPAAFAALLRETRRERMRGSTRPRSRGRRRASPSALDRRREQQRLAERDDLRLEALLPRLREEGLGIGRDHHAGDDLHALLLEGRDLRARSPACRL